MGTQARNLGMEASDPHANLFKLKVCRAWFLPTWARWPELVILVARNLHFACLPGGAEGK